MRGAGPGRAAGWVLAAVVLLLGGGAGTAAADDGVPSRAAYLAEQLRKDPVYVSDQIPRSLPRSTAPEFAKTARRTGVPTYVVALPGLLTGGEGMLAAVHDRLGRDGLYVALDEDGIDAAEGYGIDLPVGAARTAAIYAVPYDAGTVATFDYFVDVLTSGHAADIADKARQDHADARPDTRWTSRTERTDQSITTGFLMAVVPLSMLLISRYVLTRRRGRVLEAQPGTSKKARADALKRALAAQRRPRRAVWASAAACALAIGVAAQLTYSDTRSGPELDPTHADMTARADRVGAGLAHDTLYVDPESPPVLTAAQADRLRKRAKKMTPPVRIVVMPGLYDGPSAGDSILFAQKIYERTGDEAVYVMADPLHGHLRVADEGSALDSSRYALPEDVAHGAEAMSAADLPERLDTLLTQLADAPTGGPGGFPDIYSSPEDPRQANALPGLFTGDFWGGLLLLGPLAALLLWGVVVLLTRLAFGPVRGRDTVRSPHHPAPSARRAALEETAPPRPSTRWLRRTARTELDELSEEFARREADLKADTRSRVWECLDAATLFADLDGDRRLDADADAERLACVVVLLRLGAAALRADSARAAGRYCRVNPLHGPAPHARRLALPGDERPSPSHVCGTCRNLPAKSTRTGAETKTGAGARPGGRLAQAVLHLPVAGRGATTRYDEGDGPLATAGGDTDRLVNDVREKLGVH